MTLVRSQPEDVQVSTPTCHTLQSSCVHAPPPPAPLIVPCCLQAQLSEAFERLMKDVTQSLDGTNREVRGGHRTQRAVAVQCDMSGAAQVFVQKVNAFRADVIQYIKL